MTNTIDEKIKEICDKLLIRRKGLEKYESEYSEEKSMTENITSSLKKDLTDEIIQSIFDVRHEYLTSYDNLSAEDQARYFTKISTLERLYADMREAYRVKEVRQWFPRYQTIKDFKGVNPPSQT